MLYIEKPQTFRKRERMADVKPFRVFTGLLPNILLRKNHPVWIMIMALAGHERAQLWRSCGDERDYKLSPISLKGKRNA
jgi:hypothetical protein